MDGFALPLHRLDWTKHRLECYPVDNANKPDDEKGKADDAERYLSDTCDVSLGANVDLDDSERKKIRVPAEKLKLIHKGRKINKDNILEVVKERAVFQAIGVEALSEEGLNSESVSYIMGQMNVDRNSAITALRLKGDVIDAILYLGNK
ncbi:hypothetical protein HOLleu_30645 [Holothuria leucospilota]|uniref:Nascent polypeptide-associated complex subunit alpha-like UBA domain-containing protein n=1 Tax=Holothuria leucospilota TaxID=206669 RepID=A0A9Q1H0P6_HOLLE|nr:hypothetical protein HOLleu_30645 [Holothuria leucospilota]